MPLNETDEMFCRELINERHELMRRLAGLSNAAIAHKLEVSKREVDRISRTMSRKRVLSYVMSA